MLVKIIKDFYLNSDYIVSFSIQPVEAKQKEADKKEVLTEISPPDLKKPILWGIIAGMIDGTNQTLLFSENRLDIDREFKRILRDCNKE